MHPQPCFDDGIFSARSAIEPFIGACVQASVNFGTAKTFWKVRDLTSDAATEPAFSPLGSLLAGPLWDREGIVTAEIDLRAIPKAQYDFDPVGQARCLQALGERHSGSSGPLRRGPQSGARPPVQGMLSNRMRRFQLQTKKRIGGDDGPRSIRASWP
jgi:hypothetical protein